MATLIAPDLYTAQDMIQEYLDELKAAQMAAAQAESTYRIAEQDLIEARAHAQIDHRERLRISGEKTTETAIESRVTLDAVVMLAADNADDAQAAHRQAQYALELVREKGKLLRLLLAQRTGDGE